MIKGGEPKPGAARGTRAHGPSRGRRPGASQERPFLAFRRSLGEYGVASLAVLALWGTLSFGVVGCNAPVSGYGRMEATPGSFFANVRQSPGEIARLLRNAHYYKLMGRPELALKKLEQAHQQNPDNLKIVNSLAHDYEELGKFEAARQLYQEALARHGPHPVLANNLSFTYYLEGRWQEAETSFRQTLARDPGNEAARNNLGLLYCRLGRQDEARRLWQEAEGAAAADYKMGQALAALGMTGGAVYAQRPAPAPSAAKVTSSPTPAAAISRPPASRPSQVHTPAQPVTPKASKRQLASKPAAEKPIPVDAKPRQEARKQAAIPEKAPPAKAPVAANKAASRIRRGPLTRAEIKDSAIEVRNGTRSPHLARQMRALLNLEGFRVARIGNYKDFGVKQTVIYYRPGTERVAHALQADMFPTAGMEQTAKLKGEVAIKVLLGHDLLNNHNLMARLGEHKAPAATPSETPPATDKLMAAETQAERRTASDREDQGVKQEKAGPRDQPLPPKPQAIVAQPLPPLAQKPLTCAELVDTAIEVRNGTRVRNLAHETRSLLSQAGFKVAKIGNHLDFGAEKTVIYYRLGAERVARAVGRTFFPAAALEPSMKLNKGMDIKILLGADLLKRPHLMARLAGKAQ